MAFAVLLAVGQTLFKSAALSMPPLRSIGDIVIAVQEPMLWFAILLYGGATLLWIILLQNVPLTRAYSFAALGFVLVPAAGVLIFHERVNLTYLLGAALIISGILLTAKA